MEGDRQDDIQTNEENKSSARIMFAGDSHETQNKLYKRKRNNFLKLLFHFVFLSLIVFHRGLLFVSLNDE